MSENVLYVYFENGMKKDAEALRQKGQILSINNFLSCQSQFFQKTDSLHLIAHANWLVFHEYSAQILASMLLVFFSRNTHVKNLTLNGCYTGNRTELPAGMRDSFCKTLAIHLKQSLPHHEYLEVVGFTGEVFVGPNGSNAVWNRGLSRAEEHEFGRLRNRQEMNRFCKSKIRPESEATIKWFFSKYCLEITSEPPTPPNSPLNNNNNERDIFFSN
jgi:hypothetical protein